MDERWIYTTRETAAVLGVDMRTLQRHVHRGMPCEGRDRFDLREAVQWFLTWEAERQRGDAATSAAVDGLLRAQAAKVELQIARLRGDVVPVSEVQQRFNLMASTVATGLDSLGSRLAGDIADRDDVTEIAAVLDRELAAIVAAVRLAAGLSLDVEADEEA